jgi:hypothetical protein
MQPHESQKSSFSNEVLILWLDNKTFYSLISWLAFYFLLGGGVLITLTPF